MNVLQERDIQCPYCGEMMTVLLDCSVSHQVYIEDCQICCKPMTLDVVVDLDGDVIVQVMNEDG